MTSFTVSMAHHRTSFTTPHHGTLCQAMLFDCVITHTPLLSLSLARALSLSLSFGCCWVYRDKEWCWADTLLDGALPISTGGFVILCCTTPPCTPPCTPPRCWVQTRLECRIKRFKPHFIYDSSPTNPRPVPKECFAEIAFDFNGAETQTIAAACISHGYLYACIVRACVRASMRECAVRASFNEVVALLCVCACVGMSHTPTHSPAHSCRVCMDGLILSPVWLQGKTFAIATTVGKEQVGAVLQWEFMSADKDCGFALTFRPDAPDAPSDANQTLLATGAEEVLIPNESTTALV